MLSKSAIKSLKKAIPSPGLSKWLSPGRVATEAQIA
jgi:hypothetical protein